MTGIFLSQTALGSLSPTSKAEVLACLATTADMSVPTAPICTAPDFTLPQWRKFFERCSTKTRAALKVIATAPLTGFTHDQVADALRVNLYKEDLRGVWGGITKRTRAILGNKTARIIEWDFGDDGWHGRVSPKTHEALKTALGI